MDLKEGMNWVKSNLKIEGYHDFLIHSIVSLIPQDVPRVSSDYDYFECDVEAQYIIYRFEKGDIFAARISAIYSTHIELSVGNGFRLTMKKINFSTQEVNIVPGRSISFLDRNFEIGDTILVSIVSMVKKIQELQGNYFYRK